MDSTGQPASAGLIGRFEQHQVMLEQQYTGAAADQTARAAVTQVAKDAHTQEQMDAYGATMTKEEAAEYAKRIRERMRNPAVVGRGGSTMGVFSDTESLQTAQPIVPLSSATGPSPWDQVEEVEQLSDKPLSPPRFSPRRTPEFKVPFPPVPRRVASGSSFVGWGAGRSVVPGEGWKAVSPMRKLVHGAQRQ
ncbi:MAG: hypothetical protein GY820_14715, partial [Gammaproteobacteria bacterium]|nr:hypothetical protein [Gammaproteobacteria bacterium]